MDDDIERSPTAKRPCNIATPTQTKTKIRGAEGDHGDKASRKSLQFTGTSEKPMTVKVGGLPKLFLERNFVNYVEKLRDKHHIAMQTPGSAVVGVHTYDKKSRSVLIEFRSSEIAMEMISVLHNIHVMNSTLTAQNWNDNDDAVPKDDKIVPKIVVKCVRREVDQQDEHNAEQHNSLQQYVVQQIPPQPNVEEQSPVRQNFHEQTLGNRTDEMLNHTEGGLLDDSFGRTPSSGDDIYEASTDDELSHVTTNHLILSSEAERNNNGTQNTDAVPPTVSELSDDCDETNSTLKVDSNNNGTQNTITVPTSKVTVSKLPDNYDKTNSTFKVDPNNNNSTQNTVTVPTPKVTVSELPDDYDERDVTYEIHKGLWSRTDIKRPHKPIILWERSGNTEAIVTFDSVHAATTAAGLGSVELVDTEVMLKQLFEILVPSCMVKVIDLPDFFDESDLIYEIHKALWCNTEIKKPQKPVLSCERCGTTEALITFDSVKAAGIAADLKFVELYDSKVNMEQVFEAPPLEVPTCKIKVTQLPNHFEERDLIYEIHKALWANTEIKKPQKPVLSCDKSGNGEAIIRLESVKAAEIAATLKFVELEDTQVKLQQVLEVQSKEVSTCTVRETTLPNKVDENKNQVPSSEYEQFNFKNLSDEHIDKTIVPGDEPDLECEWALFDGAISSTRMETSVEEELDETLVPVELDKDGIPIVPKGQHLRKDWPTCETLNLIEGVLKFKHLICSKATQHISKGWKNIAIFMYERKLYYSLKNLKKAWKRLLETYTSSPVDWEYGPFIAMFHADDDEDVDLGPLQERLKKYKPAVTTGKPKRGLIEENKYLCGVLTLPNCEPEELSDLFSEKKTLMLIAEYSRRKKLFDDSKHRAIQIFNEIRDELHLKGYTNISSEDCAKRMAYLARRYKEISDMRLHVTGSGSEPIAWFYYDAMSQLLEGSAIMNPQKLFACGSSSMLKERVTEGLDSSVRVGRKKPATGVRKTYSSSISTASYREQKLEMGNKLRSDLQNLMSLIGKKD